MLTILLICCLLLLFTDTQGRRSEWEYPFAVAGLNLTFQVAEVLGVHNNPGQLPKTAAGACMYAWLIVVVLDVERRCHCDSWIPPHLGRSFSSTLPFIYSCQGDGN